ncbi:MAG: transposase [Anaerolineae bacterium]|nr:transposase [Gemmatimonadaceae bacterium]
MIEELTRSIPRDRHGRFDPALIAKYRRRFRQAASALDHHS